MSCLFKQLLMYYILYKPDNEKYQKRQEDN
jgi:hypothetical protein